MARDTAAEQLSEAKDTAEGFAVDFVREVIGLWGELPPSVQKQLQESKDTWERFSREWTEAGERFLEQVRKDGDNWA